MERVQFAESAGFDGAWVFDHFKPLYGDPSGPCLEAWTLLPIVARQADAWHGFGYLIAEWPSEGKRCLDEFVESVMPELAR